MDAVVSMIYHHPVFQGDDNSVAVKTIEPRQKWKHMSNRVSISSHITTSHSANLFNPRQRKKSEGRTDACHSMPFGQPVRCPLPPHVTGFTSCKFHTHCSSVTNRPLWFHIPTSESLEQLFESAGPLIELMLSVRIRYPPGRWATKIPDISWVNTPLGSLKPKLESGPPEWYTQKLVPLTLPSNHQWKISMKSQIPTSPMPPTEAPPFGKSRFKHKSVPASPHRWHWTREITPQAGNRNRSGLVPNRNRHASNRRKGCPPDKKAEMRYFWFAAMKTLA
jgi:hypothetical protein